MSEFHQSVARKNRELRQSLMKKIAHIVNLSQVKKVNFIDSSWKKSRISSITRRNKIVNFLICHGEKNKFRHRMKKIANFIKRQCKNSAIFVNLKRKNREFYVDQTRENLEFRRSNLEKLRILLIGRRIRQMPTSEIPELRISIDRGGKNCKFHQLITFKTPQISPIAHGKNREFCQFITGKETTFVDRSWKKS